MQNQSVKKEAEEIMNVMKENFIGKLNGKKCILEMKEKNLNWKQMEWAGWYVEEVGREILINKIGGSIGPRFKNTQYDYKKNYVWDLKVHSKFNPKGEYNSLIILNDLESIFNVIKDFNGVGYFIAIAEMEYDLNGEFKKWHDKLKGGISDYEKERIERNATSRKRKISCNIEKWLCIFFSDFEQLENGLKDCWVKGFQKGMRNADGSPRREKLMIDLEKLPREIKILSD